MTSSVWLRLYDFVCMASSFLPKINILVLYIWDYIFVIMTILDEYFTLDTPREVLTKPTLTIVSAFMTQINTRNDRSVLKYIDLGKSLLHTHVRQIVFIERVMYEAHFRDYAGSVSRHFDYGDASYEYIELPRLGCEGVLKNASDNKNKRVDKNKNECYITRTSLFGYGVFAKHASSPKRYSRLYVCPMHQN